MNDGVDPRLAVVIVNYESGDWLGRCLTSLERHLGDLPTQIVVIDNASQDGSETAAEDRAGVVLIRNDRNRYLSPAWNQGAARTGAPWILFLNPDTEWWSGTLERYVAEAEAAPTAGIIGPVVRNVDGSLYASGRTFPNVIDAVGHAFVTPFTRANRFTRRIEMQGWDRTTPRDVDWVSGCCMLMRRDAFDAVGGFDESFPLYFEELDISTRLRDAGWTVRFTPTVEVIHEIGASTGGGTRSHALSVMHSTSSYRYYRKHRAKGWRVVTLPLAWVALRVRAEILAGRAGSNEMRAVVLVGGFGTRMRPLTETIKKELLPLVDRPILDHTLDRLVRHGVTEVVMSSPYLEGAFGSFIEARRGSPRITWITEPAPLGTGGAIVHARDALGDEPFFAMNGDIVTDLDLGAMHDRHRERGADVSIALHHVDDARAFGLVELAESGEVLAFREKPTALVGGHINAGTYLLDPAVLEPWGADREISVEREIFPALIEGGRRVVGFASAAYWLDVGTPEKYLQAHADLLSGTHRGARYAAPCVHPDAAVANGARVDVDVSVGARCRIGEGAIVAGSVLLPGASVGAGADVRASILGPDARVGTDARVRGCVLGADAEVADGADLADARI